MAASRRGGGDEQGKNECGKLPDSGKPPCLGAGMAHRRLDSHFHHEYPCLGYPNGSITSAHPVFLCLRDQPAALLHTQGLKGFERRVQATVELLGAAVGADGAFGEAGECKT